MEKINIFIAAPNDADVEREKAQKIISELSGDKSIGCELASNSWKLEVPAGIHAETIQAYIDRKVRPNEHEIVLVIFRHRIGTPGESGGPSGTEHELAAALESRYHRGRPWTMVYFDATSFEPKNEEELAQYTAVRRLKFNLQEKIDYREFHGTKDFASVFRKHLPAAVNTYQETVGKFFDKQKYDESIVTGDSYDCLRLVPSAGQLYFSSFSPQPGGHPFRCAYISTTEGYVPKKTEEGEEATQTEDHEKETETEDREEEEEEMEDHEWVDHKIYVLRDPIRPFEIQIGEYRARRYGLVPKEVPFEGVPSLSELEASYPALMLTPQHRWLRMVLAELLSDPKALEYIDKAERKAKNPDRQILSVIARNPSAESKLSRQECRFCNGKFRGLRRVPPYSPETILIRNDFPYGPFFHYIVFPREAIHTWDAVSHGHLKGMNELIYRVLKTNFDEKEKTVMGAAGVRMGLNSSIRHLVLGRRTRASAGASIAHVHKQVWGMAPGSVNLADQLRSLCLAYEASGGDYLEQYLDALKKANLIVWEDKDNHVALYVPFGQISLHEMQVMIKRPTRTFKDLRPEELDALSTAEYIVSRLFGKLDINSFNEIMLSLPFGDESCKTFRLIFTFITREVDLAVSELSLLYVVDRHPSHTMREIARIWPRRVVEDLARMPL